MALTKILLLYISEHSGHHRASLAIEKALKTLDPAIETLNLNSFNYTNPILEKVINRAYLGVIKRTPELWDYLYDNPNVLQKTQKLRELIHRFNTDKLKGLLDEFKPNAIVCTQAFPCGMIADYKKSFNLTMPLVGVLTDYAPHSYWIYNNVDKYVVPSEETGKKLINNGIDPAKIETFGIPIDPKFQKSIDKDKIRQALSIDKDKPCVLIMGGTQGLGPIKEVVWSLDRSGMPLQMIVASGTNKKVFRWINARHFHKKVIALFDAPNVDELMDVSSIVLTKPGGITTAEALAKGIPMIIVNPLPGQEAMNTKFLLKEGVAVKAENPSDAAILLKELLYNRNKLMAMGNKARSLSRPDSAINIARLVLGLVKR